MTVFRLMAIAMIFVIAVGAWFVLGGSLEFRTATADQELKAKVGGLWGQPQEQRPPSFTGTITRRWRTEDGRRHALTTPASGLGVAGTDIRADLKLDQRRKGLLWYATYKIGMKAAYTIKNPHRAPAATRMSFLFPTTDGVYDDFKVTVDGKEVPARFGKGNRVEADFRVPARAAARVELGYRTQGLDKWTYAPTDGIGAVKDFTLVMTTDFENVDFPDGAVSPTSKRRLGRGWELTWRYASLISGRRIALDMPKPLNPGPVAARISFFAPVSLLFFFASLVLNTATSKARVHPMNYAFLAAGFFAFHLLFAYLVDRVDLGVAFAAASLTSVALCVGYLYLAIGRSRMLVESAIGQFVFLVLFSFSFFYEGYTGLAVTIGAIATLAFFMVKTGRVDWEEVFSRRGGDDSSVDGLLEHNAEALNGGFEPAT